MWHSASSRVVTGLYRVVPLAGWGITVASFFIFFGVLLNILTTGDAKWATLLVSADMFLTGVSALQQDAEAGDPPVDKPSGKV